MLILDEQTVSMLSAWLLAMVRYPEVYKRAQTEINMVIGTGRLPELHDRDSLPFLECILKEVYRFIWFTYHIVKY